MKAIFSVTVNVFDLAPPGRYIGRKTHNNLSQKPHRGGICRPDGAFDSRENIFPYQYYTPLGLFLKSSHSHNRLFAIFTILVLLALPSLAQKTKITATPAPVAKVVAAPALTMQPNELFSALNYSVDIRQPITNNNAQLEMVYSPFVVGDDFRRIKSEANDVLQAAQTNRTPINPFVVQLANMKYRYHQEFLPIDGSYNVTFIKPDLSINPKGVVTLPTNKVAGQLKYRLSF